MNLKELAANPLLLLFFSIFIGQILGRINYKNIKLGSSGGLFAGIIISYFVTRYLLAHTSNSSILNETIIPKEIFELSLIGFIASVGLIASKNIRSTIKKNGYRFMILALTITFSGALSTWFFKSILIDGLKISVIGTYVGALTSSPGLATALEIAKRLGGNTEAMIGLGYSISYMPGVVIITVFAQILGKFHRKENGLKELANKEVEEKFKESNFNIVSFCFVCLLGVIVGQINIYLGGHIGSFSVGSTGGVLIVALGLGSIKKLGFLSFCMNKNQLSTVRDICLNMFLATVGLNYGYGAINLIQTLGVQLLLVGAATSIFSILVGGIVGRKLIKLNTIQLLGGICGAMTSTPGLAASMEAADSDDVAVYYGAAYPFALLFKIVFTNILFKI